MIGDEKIAEIRERIEGHHWVEPWLPAGLPYLYCRLARTLDGQGRRTEALAVIREFEALDLPEQECGQADREEMARRKRWLEQGDH